MIKKVEKKEETKKEIKKEDKKDDQKVDKNEIVDKKNGKDPVEANKDEKKDKD